MEWKTLLVDRDPDGVVTVTFNRPEKRNALSPLLHEEMVALLDQLWVDPDCKVLVLTGKGEAFAAGEDLKEFFLELRDDPMRQERIHRLACEWRGRTLRQFPKPTIAMVNGYCFGGAFTIVESCDIAICADEAIFGLSEMNFMMIPGGTVTKSIANLLRPREALYYALSGRPFPGPEAARIGFVTFSVPKARLAEEVYILARELAGKDPHALRATKEAYRLSLSMDWDAAVNFTFAKGAEVTLNQGNLWQDVGIKDFLDKKFRPGLEPHPDTAVKP